MNNFQNIKPKGLEKQKVPWQTKPDHRIRVVDKKPKDVGSLNWSDKWNQFKKWLKGGVVEIGIGVFEKIVPTWVWVTLIIIVVITLYFGMR